MHHPTDWLQTAEKQYDFIQSVTRQCNFIFADIGVASIIQSIILAHEFVFLLFRHIRIAPFLSLQYTIVLVEDTRPQHTHTHRLTCMKMK